MKHLSENLVKASKIFIKNYEDINKKNNDLLECMVLTPETVNWEEIKELRESFNKLSNYGYLEKIGHDSYKLGILGFEELKIFIETGKTKEERENIKEDEIQNKNLNRNIRLEILTWTGLIIGIVKIYLEIKK